MSVFWKLSSENDGVFRYTSSTLCLLWRIRLFACSSVYLPIAFTKQLWPLTWSNTLLQSSRCLESSQRIFPLLMSRLKVERYSKMTHQTLTGHTRSDCYSLWKCFKPKWLLIWEKENNFSPNKTFAFFSPPVLCSMDISPLTALPWQECWVFGPHCHLLCTGSEATSEIC